MQTEVLDLMRMHSCFEGLEDDALVEIAEHMEVVRCKPGECLHQPNTPLTNIYFVVLGTLKATRRDLHGNEKVFGVFSRDDQIGAMHGDGDFRDRSRRSLCNNELHATEISAQAGAKPRAQIPKVPTQCPEGCP